MSVVAKLLLADSRGKDERIVHGAWIVGTWLACIRFWNYVRMPHGAYDPVRLAYHGWKKRLVGPIERFFLRRATKVLATSEAEARWIRDYEPRAKIEVVDLKRFFDLKSFDDVTKLLLGEPSANTRHPLARTSLTSSSQSASQAKKLHLLYLGRRHPLKGVEYLEQAVAEVNATIEQSNNQNNRTIDLRIVSDHFGDELERDWEWCDVLVLPRLSENFGLVVAEALERGKRVVTTDGAPVWEGQPGVVYLKGYREGTDEERVELLKRGLKEVVVVQRFED